MFVRHKGSYSAVRLMTGVLRKYKGKIWYLHEISIITRNYIVILPNKNNKNTYILKWQNIDQHQWYGTPKTPDDNVTDKCLAIRIWWWLLHNRIMAIDGHEVYLNDGEPTRCSASNSSNYHNVSVYVATITNNNVKHRNVSIYVATTTKTCAHH
jgi:hypothetical protein